MRNKLLTVVVKYIYVGLLLFVVGQAGCRGSLYIEKSTDYTSQAPDIKYLVSINPLFEIIDTRKAIDLQYINSENGEIAFADLLLENAQKKQVKLTVIDANALNKNDTLYFNHLAPFKQQIMQANFLQHISFTQVEMSNNWFVDNWMRPDSKYFKYNPSIPPLYSYLSEIYGTPYFAVQGVFSVVEAKKRRWLWLFLVPPIGLYQFIKPEVKTYFYTIIVNVRSSEIIYREVRSFNNFASKQNLNSMIYDSFSIIKMSR